MTSGGSSRLDMAGERATAVVDLDHGGRLASLMVDGTELLVTRSASPTPDDPVSWGAYPMVPWAGRVDRGRFRFAATTYELPVNRPPHALHGTGFDSRWQLVGNTTIGCRFDDRWPFAGTVTQSFSLQPDHLETTMTVRADETMPLLIGWHPWFRRRIEAPSGIWTDVELDFGSPSMYELDDRAIPTGRLVPCPPGPWDNCFTGLTRNPRLCWPGVARITMSSDLDHWVVFDRQAHAVCVEPQSGAPDEFNRRPTVLAAGETRSARYRISWTATP